MAGKKKITGRIAYALNLEDSQIYWTCPTRGCKHIHYFTFIHPQSSGATPVYQKLCSLCKKEYIATQMKVQGSTALLVASEITSKEDNNATSTSK